MNDAIIKDILENLFILDLQKSGKNHRSAKVIENLYFKFKKKLCNSNLITWNCLYWNTSLKIYRYKTIKIHYGGEYDQEDFNDAMKRVYKECHMETISQRVREYNKWKTKWIFDGLLPITAYYWEIPTELKYKPILRIT